jgi:hypothetical protein
LPHLTASPETHEILDLSDFSCSIFEQRRKEGNIEKRQNGEESTT